MASLPSSYFDELYSQNPDPWGFASSPYEAAKYAATMKALPRRRYAEAMEVGCSIGILTSLIAQRCLNLLALDVAEAALSQARERNSARGNVRVEQGEFPANLPLQLPEHGFDLILLSEILYYLDENALNAAAARILSLAKPGADIVLVHWLGPTPDYPLTGDEASDQFIAALGDDATLLEQQRHAGYRIDVLRRSDTG